MTDEEKREALLKLAQLAGIPNPETIHSNSLSFVISCTLDEMLNQFYKYRYEEAPDEDEPQDKKKKNIWKDADQYSALEEAEDGAKIPDAKEIATYAYDALTSLSYPDCVFLYGLLQSGDPDMAELAKSTLILSVRAAINSLLRRINYQYTTDENSRDIRADGILEANECALSYDPVSGGSKTTFFTYSYKKLWAALLASMNGYDKNDDKARHFYSRAGKVVKALGYYASRGIMDPTDVQLAAYINQNTSKKQQLSPELVREARQKLPSRMRKYLNEFQMENQAASQDETDAVEKRISIMQAIDSLPQEHADIIRIIVHLQQNGAKDTGWRDLAPLIRARYKEQTLSDADIKIMVQKAREAFKAAFLGSDYTPLQQESHLIEAILVTEDYTDDMLNILENNEPSEIF